MDVPDRILWLDGATVAALLPGYPEQVELLARMFRAAAQGGVENPPKLGVHPRPDAFLHAMPAYVHDGDVTAMKWVAAYPGNPARGLPYVSGLVVLNDSGTGLPLAVMDAGALTATRTAAVTGVAVRHLAAEGWDRAAILGYGAQGRAHAAMLRALRPDARIRVYAGPRRRVPDADARDGHVQPADDARSAVEGAQVVVTAGPMTEDPDRTLDPAWLAGDALVLPVDFDAYVPAGLAGAAEQLLVDDAGQFAHHRTLGRFAGWPEPDGVLGAALDTSQGTGLRVVCSLGVGAADAVLADAVWRRATADGHGRHLSR